MKNFKIAQLSLLLTISLLSQVTSPGMQALAASPTDTPSQQVQATKGSESETIREEQNAFFESDYTYDDAAMLANYWGESVSESKAWIGRKILWNVEDNVSAMLETVAQDAFFGSDYTYDDAAVLASYWGQPVSESKTWIGRKILFDIEDVVPTVLEDARNQAATTEVEQAAFFSSDYTYDDAAMLASYWGQSVSESKAWMGRKIQAGPEAISVVNGYLDEAQHADNG